MYLLPIDYQYGIFQPNYYFYFHGFLHSTNKYYFPTFHVSTLPILSLNVTIYLSSKDIPFVIAHFRVSLCLCLKGKPCVKFFMWIELICMKKRPVSRTHFNVQGFAEVLDLKHSLKCQSSPRPSTQWRQLGNGLLWTSTSCALAWLSLRC